MEQELQFPSKQADQQHFYELSFDGPEIQRTHKAFYHLQVWRRNRKPTSRWHSVWRAYSLCFTLQNRTGGDNNDFWLDFHNFFNIFLLAELASISISKEVIELDFHHEDIVTGIAVIFYSNCPRKYILSSKKQGVCAKRENIQTSRSPMISILLFRPNPKGKAFVGKFQRIVKRDWECCVWRPSEPDRDMLREH